MAPRNMTNKIAYADWIAKSTSAQNPTSSDPASPAPTTPTTPRRRGAKAGPGRRYQPFDYTAVETPPPEVPSQSSEPQPSHESSANEGVPPQDEQKIAAESDDQNQHLASNSREVTPKLQDHNQPALTSPSQTTAVDDDRTTSQEQPHQTTAFDYDQTTSQEEPSQSTTFDCNQTASQEQPPQTTLDDLNQTEPLQQQSQVSPVKSTYSQAPQKNLPQRQVDPVTHTHSQAPQQTNRRRTSAKHTRGQAAQQRHHRRTSADHTQGQAAHQNYHRRTSANYGYGQGFQQTSNQPANSNPNQAFTPDQQQHTSPQANLEEDPHQQVSRHNPSFVPVLPQPSEFPTPEAHTYSALYGGYFSQRDLRYIHHVFDTLSQQAFFALHNMPSNNPTSPAVPDAASSTSNESMDKYAWARGILARERARERAEQEEERRQAEAAQSMQSSSIPQAYGSQLHSRQASGTSHHSGPQQARPAFGPHPSFAMQHGTPGTTAAAAAAMPSTTSTPGNNTPTATATEPKTILLAPDVKAANDTWPMFRLALAARLELLQKEAQEYEERIRRNKEQAAAMDKQQQQAASARRGHARKDSWLKEQGKMHRVEDQTFGGLPFGMTGEQASQHERSKSGGESGIASKMQQLTLANVAAGKVDISKRKLMSFTDEELFGAFGFKAPGPKQIQDLFDRYHALLLAEQQKGPTAAATSSAAAPVLPGPGLGFGMAAPAPVVPTAGAEDQHFLADTYSAHGGPKLPAEHVSRALRAAAPFVPAPGAPGPARPVVKSSAEAKPAVSPAVAPARKKETFVPGISGTCFGAFDRSVWNGRQLPRELRRGGEEKKKKREGEKEKKKEMGFLPGLGFDQV